MEGSTGTNATDVFVRQDNHSWYLAVFNYTSSDAIKTLSLNRLAMAGSYVAQDLWSGAVSAVGGTAWHVSLGARQAKLFRLRSGSTRVVGPTNAS